MNKYNEIAKLKEKCIESLDIINKSINTNNYNEVIELFLSDKDLLEYLDVPVYGDIDTIKDFLVTILKTICNQLIILDYNKYNENNLDTEMKNFKLSGIPYPEPSDKDFYNKIFNKKEFRDNLFEDLSKKKIEDLCKEDVFRLFSQQKFLKIILIHILLITDY